MAGAEMSKVDDDAKTLDDWSDSELVQDGQRAMFELFGCKVEGPTPKGVQRREPTLPHSGPCPRHAPGTAGHKAAFQPAQIRTSGTSNMVPRCRLPHNRDICQQ
jgi:hypothetical protein